MNQRKEFYLLVLLILILFLVNYQFFGFLEKDLRTVVVERVIDGDTIVVDGGSVRLMGINSPEKGENYFGEAKEFLEMIILNKTVELESFGFDKYDRELAYVFYKGENVNLELVDEGFANFYILDERKYEKDLKGAWEKCIRMNKYLCEKSFDKCAGCVELKELDYKKEIVTFENVCDFDCDVGGWEIKDEGRKKFVFDDFVLKGLKEVKVIVEDGVSNDDDVLFWDRKDYVWTDSGDTLFLRDDAGKLVLYYSY